MFNTIILSDYVTHSHGQQYAGTQFVLVLCLPDTERQTNDWMELILFFFLLKNTISFIIIIHDPNTRYSIGVYYEKQTVDHYRLIFT